MTAYVSHTYSAQHKPYTTCPRCLHTGLVQVIRFAASREQAQTTVASCAACSADLHPGTFADLGTTLGD